MPEVIPVLLFSVNTCIRPRIFPCAEDRRFWLFKLRVAYLRMTRHRAFRVFSCLVLGESALRGDRFRRVLARKQERRADEPLPHPRDAIELR